MSHVLVVENPQLSCFVWVYPVWQSYFFLFKGTRIEDALGSIILGVEIIYFDIYKVLQTWEGFILGIPLWRLAARPRPPAPACCSQLALERRRGKDGKSE